MMKFLLFLILGGVFSLPVWAECPDISAIYAADQATQDYMDGKVFKKARVLKKHLPSYRKEIASYIYVEDKGLYFTVYTLVNSECEVAIIKSTRGKH
ncbi:hypothetical protein [Marinomonas algarum]|uniref:Uncharacterized protein n=1 Tax=Marinomonas algarum TaxID=2883105 RepID=A0A9X1IJD8_9GAMM|nr:hypothetical protein [Marinomonas algarum]MCB5160365.1 hypothetical protein [Marinomonas algarum]